MLFVTSAAGVERRLQCSSFPTPHDAVNIQVGALCGLVREGFDDGRCGEKTGGGDDMVAARWEVVSLLPRRIERSTGSVGALVSAPEVGGRSAPRAAGRRAF